MISVGSEFTPLYLHDVDAGGGGRFPEYLDSIKSCATFIRDHVVRTGRSGPLWDYANAAVQSGVSASARRAVYEALLSERWLREALTEQ
jgi:hypothetical protein